VTRRLAAWWRRRDLHTRLSLLVAGAVAASVLVLAVAAWIAAAELQERRISAQLNADAVAIAARPQQWVAARPWRGRPGGRFDLRDRRELGPRWQVIDSSGAVLSAPDGPLPVTGAARLIAATREHAAEERVTVGDADFRMVTVPIRGGGAVQVALDQAESTRTLRTLAFLLAGGCVLGVGGAAFAGRAVARAGLRPVQRLTDAVEERASGTDPTRPIAVTGADEVARLGRSVNTMLAAIESSRRAQRALVEDAGHELRTPLTSIRTNVELLLAVERNPSLADRLPPQERAKLLADLDAQVRELATLTTELVELSRAEAARESAEPVDLVEVVAAAVSRVRTRAPGLDFVVDARPVTVTGRPGELERMVVNVLDNAAKWSPPGATVRVAVTPEGTAWCRLTVADTGPGIAADDLPYIFDRFYRAPAARSMPGSGLGLAIVAQTAAQHGGSVAAAAQEPAGTVLTIRLPVAGPDDNRR
jgi:two-component system, OmpR family, sensor histidine kinase MprB